MGLDYALRKRGGSIIEKAACFIHSIVAGMEALTTKWKEW